MLTEQKWGDMIRDAQREKRRSKRAKMTLAHFSMGRLFVEWRRETIMLRLARHVRVRAALKMWRSFSARSIGRSLNKRLAESMWRLHTFRSVMKLWRATLGKRLVVKANVNRMQTRRNDIILHRKFLCWRMLVASRMARRRQAESATRFYNLRVTSRVLLVWQQRLTRKIAERRMMRMAERHCRTRAATHLLPAAVARWTAFCRCRKTKRRVLRVQKIATTRFRLSRAVRQWTVVAASGVCRRTLRQSARVFAFSHRGRELIRLWRINTNRALLRRDIELFRVHWVYKRILHQWWQCIGKQRRADDQSIAYIQQQCRNVLVLRRAWSMWKAALAHRQCLHRSVVSVKRIHSHVWIRRTMQAWRALVRNVRALEQSADEFSQRVIMRRRLFSTLHLWSSLTNHRRERKDAIMALQNRIRCQHLASSMLTWQQNVRRAKDRRARCARIGYRIQCMRLSRLFGQWRCAFDLRLRIERFQKRCSKLCVRSAMLHWIRLYDARQENAARIRKLASIVSRLRQHSVFRPWLRLTRDRLSLRANIDRAESLLRRKLLSQAMSVWRSRTEHIVRLERALSACRRIRLRKWFVPWAQFAAVQRHMRSIEQRAGGFRRAYLISSSWFIWRRQFHIIRCAAIVCDRSVRRTRFCAFRSWQTLYRARVLQRMMSERARDFDRHRVLGRVVMLWIGACRYRIAVKTRLLQSSRCRARNVRRELLRESLHMWFGHASERRRRRLLLKVQDRALTERVRLGAMMGAFELWRRHFSASRLDAQRIDVAAKHRQNYIDHHRRGVLSQTIAKLRLFAMRRRELRHLKVASDRHRILRVLRVWHQRTQQFRELADIGTRTAVHVRQRALLAKAMSIWLARIRNRAVLRRVLAISEKSTRAHSLAQSMMVWRGEVSRRLRHDSELVDLVTARSLRRLLTKILWRWHDAARAFRNLRLRRIHTLWRRWRAHFSRRRKHEYMISRAIEHDRLGHVQRGFVLWRTAHRISVTSRHVSESHNIRILVRTWRVWFALHSHAVRIRDAGTAFEESRDRRRAEIAIKQWWCYVVHRRRVVSKAESVKAFVRQRRLCTFWLRWRHALGEALRMDRLCLRAELHFTSRLCYTVMRAWYETARLLTRQRENNNRARRHFAVFLCTKVFWEWHDHAIRKKQLRYCDRACRQVASRFLLQRSFTLWQGSAEESKWIGSACNHFARRRMAVMFVEWREWTRSEQIIASMRGKYDQDIERKHFLHWRKKSTRVRRFRELVARVTKLGQRWMKVPSQRPMYDALERWLFPARRAFFLLRKYARDSRRARELQALAVQHRTRVLSGHAFHAWCTLWRTMFHMRQREQAAGLHWEERSLTRALESWVGFIISRRRRKLQQRQALLMWARHRVMYSFSLWRFKFQVVVNERAFRQKQDKERMQQVLAISMRAALREQRFYFVVWRERLHRHRHVASRGELAARVSGRLLARRVFRFWHAKTAWALEHRIMHDYAVRHDQHARLVCFFVMWQRRTRDIIAGRERIIHIVHGLKIIWQRRAFHAWLQYVRNKHAGRRHMMLQRCFLSWKAFAKRTAVIRRELVLSRQADQ